MQSSQAQKVSDGLRHRKQQIIYLNIFFFIFYKETNKIPLEIHATVVRTSKITKARPVHCTVLWNIPDRPPDPLVTFDV